MKIKRMCLFGMICLFILLLCACGLKKDTPASLSPSPNDDTSLSDQNSQDKDISENPGEGQPQEELGKSLAAYREEREKTTDVKMSNGVSGYGAPNLKDYGLDADGWDYTSRFDSREVNEAFEAAEKYVVETLGIKVETKPTVYPCVDPKVFSIYKDEDKGVASVYEADNIFICEYCDNGIWQYLILVRDAKGEPWKVIHHGDSYQND